MENRCLQDVASDICVFIGRFEPLHRGHVYVIAEGLRRGAHMVVLVGSANQPRTLHNPFTYPERAEVIRATFGNDPRLVVLPIEDSHNDVPDWVARVQATVRKAWATIRPAQSPLEPSVALIGHAKDASSFYLDLFPQWASINVPQQHLLSATTIRQALFGGALELEKPLDPTDVAGQDRYVALARTAALAFLAAERAGQSNGTADLPLPVIDFLTRFIPTPAYRQLVLQRALNPL